MAVDLMRSRVLFKLLEASTSLGVVSDFLKTKKLHYSAGSWQAMADLRLLPALENEQISNEDLEQLVQEAEEYGRQHVFLYTCSSVDAIKMVDRKTVATQLQHRKIEYLLTQSKLVEDPQGVEIVDVRWDTAKVDYRLILKEVELKTHDKLIGTRTDGDRLYKEYQREKERAVNVVRLHIDGFLEIRIASHRNSSRYEDDIFRIFQRLSGLLDSTCFTELSITTAKDYIWSKRKELNDTVRYADSRIRNSAGNLLQGASGGRNGDLNADDGVSESLDKLRNDDVDAYCDSTNIYFKAGEDITAETHVMLSGEINEFALPANCTRADYEYVLGRLRFFNR